MSLRVRLTLVAAATVTLALVVFTLTAATRTRTVLEKRSHQELAAMTNGMLPIARNQVVRVAAGKPPNDYAGLLYSRLRDSYPGYAVVVQRDGTLLPLPQLATTSRDVPAVPADVFARSGGDDFALRTDGGDRYVARVVDVPGSDAVLFAALSDERTAATVAELLRTFIVTGAVLIVAFVVITALAVRFGLRPLRAITDATARVGDGSTAERVPAGAPGTELGELAGAINEMLDALDRSAAEREATLRRTERFAADAAHELRTPVTAILGYADLYRQGAIKGDERLAEVFGRVHHEAGRLRDLVEGLLLLDRIDQHATRVGGATAGSDAIGGGAIFDAVAVCEEVAADSRAIDTTRTITVERGADESIGVRGDRDRAFQMIANLVANVRAHTPAGTTATISLTVLPDAAVQIDVADDGPGIGTDDRAHVFDRFYRADAARSRGSGGGSGLGLAIVSALARELGGSVALVDGGPGTTVRVVLPGAVDRGGDTPSRPDIPDGTRADARGR